MASIQQMRDFWPMTGVAPTGRAGVGKSRLAREAVAEAGRSGWSVRHVAATATGRSVPLGEFAHWTDEFDGARP